MGLNSTIIRFLQGRQARARERRRGAIGDFYRAGGNPLLHDLPVGSDDVVIDAGGFEGDWAAAMLVRTGCRIELYEPVPAFAARCRALLGRNGRVRVVEAALGGSERTARFAVDSVASSEFTHRGGTVEARVEDAHAVVGRLAAAHGEVACLKLNIEGGEYEVLERILERGDAARCRSILVQFHAQPEGWERRMSSITERLSATHEAAWRFPMVWEKWVRR